MKVFRSHDEVTQANITGVALTMGSFDGVHKGHVFLLESLHKMAPQCPRAVITFDPHPATILSGHSIERIFSQEDQINRFKELGVEYLYFLPFSQAVAAQTAEEFATSTIFELFKPSAILVGYDFAFGKDRKGDLSFLSKMAQSHHCQVQRCEPFLLEGQVISSTRIRDYVRAGQMENATNFLGRPFYIQRPVVEGKKLGRTIGIPTANFGLLAKEDLTPQSGVYMTSIQIADRQFFSITNVGTNPTVTEDLSTKIETYVLDFDQDLYGQVVKVEFLQKIREEKKFSSLNELKTEIQHDIFWARQYIKAQSKV